MISTRGKSSLPAGVRWYSKPAAPRRRSRTPARCNSFSRLDSSEDDIRGTPRCRSLKRTLPQSSSRTTNGVQRSANTSAACATGQNWPYPFLLAIGVLRQADHFYTANIEVAPMDNPPKNVGHDPWKGTDHEEKYRITGT